MEQCWLEGEVAREERRIKVAVIGNDSPACMTQWIQVIIVQCYNKEIRALLLLSTSIWCCPGEVTRIAS